MSVMGIGTDIVSLDRIGKVLQNSPEKFCARLLTPTELEHIPQNSKQLIHFVAKRWAAKEAVAKAFGTGIGGEFSFQDVEINHNEKGTPQIQLSQKALELAQKKNINDWQISISDETHYAIAFVVASK